MTVIILNSFVSLHYCSLLLFRAQMLALWGEVSRLLAVMASHLLLCSVLSLCIWLIAMVVRDDMQRRYADAV